MGDEERHDVTIGIPTLNDPRRLDRCLKSIMAHTQKSAAAVLVCDDGSKEEALEGNKDVTSTYRVPMLMNQARLGVAESWNRLTRHAAAHFGSRVMVLVNDDVEVVADWLDALVFSVLENPHAGMVGLPSWPGVTSETFKPPLAPNYYEATMRHGHGLLASCGYCFAFSVEKFEAVGGFDSEYFCFYEDVSYGLALLHKGWPSYMLDRPIVLHQVGATTRNLGNIDAKAQIEESRAKFKAKWQSVAHQREIFKDKRWPECVSWNSGLKALVD